ncbi:MAG: uracil phosphoribosyltransferase [Treponema sp.]|jgi:uracil phosphoribosyltransferase|nr:uracil phosphoribosyltransferase [Treponema sp.]
MSHIILKAEDLDGYLTENDKLYLERMDILYRQAMVSFGILATTTRSYAVEREKQNLIKLYNEMGAVMQEICQYESGIQVYSFCTPSETHAETSRVIAKLRNQNTEQQEFVYYMQRAYELLFQLAYGGTTGTTKTYRFIKTPVTMPVQNYAVHKITNIDDKIENTVICVMLRGALLPSMILSKEIQEYSSHDYVTPFALFRIKRDESKHENDMEYLLDLDRSFFDIELLQDKDLIFADPMNATGGSLVTVVKYLLDSGVQPRSIQFFNVIAALKGSLRVVRALEHCKVFTLWMDPALNELAYIMPGLGDAGDRLNGADTETPRNIIQLIADYGVGIANLYREQLREIENTVLNVKRNNHVQ